MYNIEILYDLSMTFITKLFTKNSFVNNINLRPKLINQYVDLINSYEFMDDYNYHMFDDFCTNPILELNKIYTKLKPQKDDIILSSMYLDMSPQLYKEMIEDNIPCFVPMNNNIDEDYITRYMVDKIYDINGVKLTDYDMVFFKKHVLPKHDLYYIKDTLDYFYENIKDSKLNLHINSKNVDDIMEVLNYINKYDINNIKTNILEQIYNRERNR